MSELPTLSVAKDVLWLDGVQDVIIARWPDGYTMSRVGSREALEDPYAAVELAEEFAAIRVTHNTWIGELDETTDRGRWRRTLIGGKIKHYVYVGRYWRVPWLAWAMFS